METEKASSRSSSDDSVDQPLKPALEDSQHWIANLLLLRAWHYVKLARDHRLRVDDLRALPAGCSAEEVAQLFVKNLEKHKTSRYAAYWALWPFLWPRVYVKPLEQR